MDWELFSIATIVLVPSAYLVNIFHDYLRVNDIKKAIDTKRCGKCGNGEVLFYLSYDNSNSILVEYLCTDGCRHNPYVRVSKAEEKTLIDNIKKSRDN